LKECGILDIKELQQLSKQLRVTVLKMLNKAGSGHTGGSLSCVEILVAVYKTRLWYNPREPNWSDRDRFILSKGHAAPTLYALLAEEGFFPKEDLFTLRKIGGKNEKSHISSTNYNFNRSFSS
jgi:transketolase